MKDRELVIMHDGCKYNFVYSSGKARVFISEDERSCLITDIDNDIQMEIRATTICNSGFLKIIL
jgi:hypothetical protein